MAVKDAVPPVPRNGGSGSRTPSGARRVGSKAAMRPTPDTSSNESAKQPISPERAAVSPTQAVKQSPSPSYVKQSSSAVYAKAPVSPTRQMQMPPTPMTPGRAGAEDSDDSYLSAVSETARVGLQSADDSDSSSGNRILGRHAFGKNAPEGFAETGGKASRGHTRAGSTSTARGAGGRVTRDLPSPTVSETTAVGSVHAA